ncbi:MAG: hypothetical protein FJ011_20335 [Chloroflexi bacterium]|nr:hypothetical protein [Chloroflexota bacterium]
MKLTSLPHSTWKQRLTSEKGQQLLQFALLLPLLLGFLGLVMDAGNVYVHHRRVQAAADASVAAAGMVLYQSGVTPAMNTAFYYATEYGYNNNGITNTVTVSSPPAAGAFAGDSRYIQVQIQEQVQPIFASIVWPGSFQVSARGTAGYTLHALGADIYVLKDSGAAPCNATLTMNGNTGRVTATNGTVQVNSPCATAVAVGNGDIYAGQINIVGGYSKGPNGVLSPTPRTGAPPIPDPLASLPAPTGAGCPARSGPVSGKYLPGVYPSGFSPDFDYPFDGSSGVCDGVFYFNSGLNATGNKHIVINQGMFYFAAGGLTLGGNADMQGSAPTSGPYAGMLVFMARNNSSTFYLHGTPQAGCTFALASLKGIVYLPKGHLKVQGTSDMCVASPLITWTYEGNGNATTTIVVYEGTKPGTTVTNAQVE